MKKVAVVGGGPAGLMAAEVLSGAGMEVHLYDAMASVGRKFLMAGKGGLNLTHSEPPALFATRYAGRQPQIEPLLAAFGATELRAWARSLGVETFVGSSGRVFPVDLKAAPLLRAWLHRLRGAGVQFHMRHRWTGWRGASGPDVVVDPCALTFITPQDSDPVQVQADAVVLALGGASWARLGSDGRWASLLAAHGIPIAPLQPANCGFDVGSVTRAGWTEHFRDRFAGQPFKTVMISFTDSQGHSFHRKGEFVATATGVEGSLIYAAANLLRDEVAAHGSATFHLDLLPDKSREQVLAEVMHPRGSRTRSSHLKSRLGLDGIKAGILHELLTREDMALPEKLAAAIKALPIRVTALRPIDEAISTEGGVPFCAMDEYLMLNQLPGVFCAGEMLDWEAPTGGYLLAASFASGKQAGEGALRWGRGEKGRLAD